MIDDPGRDDVDHSIGAYHHGVGCAAGDAER
jgi:hypothetical protein